MEGHWLLYSIDLGKSWIVERRATSPVMVEQIRIKPIPLPLFPVALLVLEILRAATYLQVGYH